jgi:hypothetical protein
MVCARVRCVRGPFLFRYESKLKSKSNTLSLLLSKSGPIPDLTFTTLVITPGRGSPRVASPCRMSAGALLRDASSTCQTRQNKVPPIAGESE